MPSSCHTASSYLAPSSSSCLSCQTYTPCASLTPYPTSVLWCSLPLPLACQYTMVRDSHTRTRFPLEVLCLHGMQGLYCCVLSSYHMKVCKVHSSSHKYVRYTAAITCMRADSCKEAGHLHSTTSQPSNGVGVALLVADSPALLCSCCVSVLLPHGTPLP